ncbi:MAG: FMN-binding protein [Candidatus Altiarchaeales archaeon]|nr:FMN-binding protein [Candidatus Altiarchaeales archaeon]
MSEATKMISVLTLICLASALSLSLVYANTSELIEQNKKDALTEAMTSVQPRAREFKVEVETQNHTIYAAQDEDHKQIGYVSRSWASGFNNKIEYVVGLDKNLEVTGVAILSHEETPGLGSKITEDDFLKQFKGDSLKSYDVDAISGATISSSALIDSVKETLNKTESEVGK